ncbi:hypothetical protein BDV18DRAFT_144636 [Aspergillus unguis]
MDNLPECALTCLVTALRNSTCGLTDVSCICADTDLFPKLEPCMVSNCTVKESLTAQNVSYTTCDYPATENTGVFPIINIVGLVVAILSVVMRVTNSVVARQLKLDDYAIVVSLFVAIAISAITFPLKTLGLGKNMWTIPFHDIYEALKLFLVAGALYTACTALVKVSVLLFYLRIFPNRLLRLATFVSLGIIIAWGAVYVFAEIFWCSPVSYFWTQWDREHVGKCFDHDALLLSHAGINMFLDITVVLLPMPVLARLQMSLEKRVGMCVMFATGLVVTAVSILRLVKTVGFGNTTNPTKDFVPVGIYSIVEVDVGILCACMPGIRAFCKRVYCFFFNKPTGYTYGSYPSARKPVSGTGSVQSPPNPVPRPGHLSSDKSQFIQLQDVGSSDGGWPLRQQTSETMLREDEFTGVTGPTMLNPTGLGPNRHHFFNTVETPRSDSARSTWFREDDSP